MRLRVGKGTDRTGRVVRAKPPHRPSALAARAGAVPAVPCPPASPRSLPLGLLLLPSAAVPVAVRELRRVGALLPPHPIRSGSHRPGPVPPPQLSRTAGNRSPPISFPPGDGKGPLRAPLPGRRPPYAV